MSEGAAVFIDFTLSSVYYSISAFCVFPCSNTVFLLVKKGLPAIILSFSTAWTGVLTIYIPRVFAYSKNSKFLRNDRILFLSRVKVFCKLVLPGINYRYDIAAMSIIENR